MKAGRERRRANEAARAKRKEQANPRGAFTLLHPPIRGPKHEWSPAVLASVSKLFPAQARTTKAAKAAAMAIAAPATIPPKDRIGMLDAVPAYFRVFGWAEARAAAETEIAEAAKLALADGWADVREHRIAAPGNPVVRVEFRDLVPPVDGKHSQCRAFLNGVLLGETQDITEERDATESEIVGGIRRAFADMGKPLERGAAVPETGARP